MNIGVIGCGFIGTELAKFIDGENEFSLIGINDVDRLKADRLAKALKNNSPEFLSINDIVKECDIIIESASKDAVKAVLQDRDLDRESKKLLIMSTGGLIGNMELLGNVKHCSIFLPSGAIAGIDAIKSVSGKIGSLALTTTKPVDGLHDAPFIRNNKIGLKDIKSKKTVFEGSLEEAVEGFPKNINVAATLFLASKFNGIKIKIVVDPNAKLNTHQIEVTGDFGKITAIAENVPSENPRTSYLAVLSAINALKGMKSNIHVGN